MVPPEGKITMHILVFGGKKTRFGRLIAVLLIFAVAVPLITHYQLGRHDTDDAFFPGPFMSRTQKASHSEETLADYAELLKKEVEELKRIKRSLSNELRALEGSRAKVQRDIQKFGEKADYARSQAEKLRAAVSRAERDLEMIKLAKKEATDCPQLPHLKLPMRLMADSLNVGISPSDEELSSMCDLNTCFDFSRCSYSSGFPLYIYDPMVNGVGSTVEESNSIADFIKKGPHHVSDASKACLFIVVAGTVQESDAVKIERQLHSLPYWGKNGQNHVILQINMADSLSSNPPTDISSLNISCGLASLGQSSFHGRRSYRQGFDLILPPIQRMLATENIWEIAALQLPASRKYLLSFQGTQRNFEGKIFPEELKELGEEAEDIFIETTCQIEPANDIHNGGVWSLCGSHGDRIEVLRQSMFTLVLGRSEIGASWSATLVRLVEALQAGAIPVVLAGNIPLPFNDLIMWTEAAIVLPPARITELNVLLRTVGNADILSMRRQGRFLWESYFSSGTALAETALAVFRSRLKIPAPPMAVAHTTSVFTDENRPVINPADPAAIIQLARPSPSFTRNLTVTTVDSYRLWNSPPGPFGLYPSSPFDPVFPSSAPFYQSAKGFDLIGKGEGGSGKEFSQSLGGNYPKDQFTVVMLTYERELVLMEALQRLVGLQYLNRVVVIWNSPNPPAPSLRWPNIGVPLHVSTTWNRMCSMSYFKIFSIEKLPLKSLEFATKPKHDMRTDAWQISLSTANTCHLYIFCIAGGYLDIAFLCSYMAKGVVWY